MAQIIAQRVYQPPLNPRPFGQVFVPGETRQPGTMTPGSGPGGAPLDTSIVGEVNPKATPDYQPSSAPNATGASTPGALPPAQGQLAGAECTGGLLHSDGENLVRTAVVCGSDSPAGLAAGGSAPENAGEAFKTVFRFHDASDPTSLLSRFSFLDPEVQASILEELKSEQEAAELAEAHMQGFVEGSPFVSVTDDPAAAAVSGDFWMRYIASHAPSLSEFSVPVSRLFPPSNALSISEGEHLFLGDDLINYLVETRQNPFLPPPASAPGEGG